MTGDITTALSVEQTALPSEQKAPGPTYSEPNTKHGQLRMLKPALTGKDPKKPQGFTLIELMVVIVIAAILLTIAVPSFDNMIRRNTVESLQTTLGGALATARTEAASRNAIVTICAINDDSDDCSGEAADWDQGWIVFVDQNGNGEVDADDVVIDLFEYSGGYTFTAASTSAAPALLSFNSQGFLAGNSVPTLITVCDPRGNDNFARGLYVNSSGLVMKTARADGETVHSNPLDDKLECP